VEHFETGAKAETPARSKTTSNRLLDIGVMVIVDVRNPTVYYCFILEHHGD
jgi:hypothetical protein